MVPQADIGFSQKRRPVHDFNGIDHGQRPREASLLKPAGTAIFYSGIEALLAVLLS